MLNLEYDLIIYLLVSSISIVMAQQNNNTPAGKKVDVTKPVNLNTTGTEPQTGSQVNSQNVNVPTPNHVTTAKADVNKTIGDVVIEQAQETNDDKIHITKGTLYDKVNPPSNGVSNDKKVNPDSEEALKQRIEAERNIGLGNQRYQEELAKKIRLESVQNTEYKLPEDLKNDPNTPDYLKTSFRQTKEGTQSQNAEGLKG